MFSPSKYLKKLRHKLRFKLMIINFIFNLIIGIGSLAGLGSK